MQSFLNDGIEGAYSSVNSGIREHLGFRNSLHSENTSTIDLQNLDLAHELKTGAFCVASNDA